VRGPPRGGHRTIFAGLLRIEIVGVGVRRRSGFFGGRLGLRRRFRGGRRTPGRGVGVRRTPGRGFCVRRGFVRWGRRFGGCVDTGRLRNFTSLAGLAFGREGRGRD